jgi:DNA-binding MarR family transcriptional regulator
VARMERLEDCISFLISKANQQISRRTRERLAPHGVTPSQYAVLRALWEREAQSSAEVASRLVMDSATITGVVDRLQAAGLLERRPDGDDRRVHRLALTAKGSALQAPLDAAMGELNEEVAREMEGEAATVWSALRRLGEDGG